MVTAPNYNPDVLTCLANLSNDEVFTPPAVVNQMLDLLPADLWRNSSARFLDPACKTGVFLREIAKRLMAGLEDEIPDLQQRANHIFTKQLFGLAITQLTSMLSRRSVYCSKTANGQFSVCDAFTSAEGNIRFEAMQHDWKDGRCRFCGASQTVYDRGEEMEQHAYQFIHTYTPEEIFGTMKFDVIIGNPPYQLEDGGSGKSAKPIYHLFIEQAKKLNPQFLCMIIPSRWFSGGKGLDDFRDTMLNDRHISHLVDFENSNEVFPGVDIAGGVCYFLWNKSYRGKCQTDNVVEGNKTSMDRYLNDYPVFIRRGQSLKILQKILSYNENSGRRLSERVSSRKPFGMPTNYPPQFKGVPCYFIQRIGKQFASPADVTDKFNLLDKWKLLLPKSPIAGQTDFSKPVGFYYDGNTHIARPNECCTESYIVGGAFDTENEVLSYKSYLFTKVVRFLLLQCVISQDVTKQNFMFVPDLGKYDHQFSDEELRERWNITDDEWRYIDSRIK